MGHGPSLLQVRDECSSQKNGVPDNGALPPIVFVSTSLTNTETRYSNIEGEAPAILYIVQKFHHILYNHEVSVRTGHRLLMEIFKKM